MNLKEVLLKEHSKRQCDRVVAFVGKSPSRFSQLVDVFLSGPYRVTQRAAWPLSCCVEKFPQLIQPHLKQILAFSGKQDAHDAVKRNVLRLLQFIDIPPRLQGQAADVCFHFFASKKEPSPCGCSP